MKMKNIFALVLILLFTISFVQASPIVEISVDDTWEYTGEEIYDYTVIDKQDFANGEEYVELIEITTNEIIEIVDPYLNVIDDMERDVTLDLQATFTAEERWHTARGNFIAILEKSGTFELNTIVIMNVTLERFDYYDTGTVNYQRYYLNFDLQSPIVTGNPIYAERITIWQLEPIGLTYIDITTYRIDGTDEFTVDYQGTPTQVRNVTIVPNSRIRTAIGDYIHMYDRVTSVDGMKQYLWVFANDIGLPIYKETSTLSLSPLVLDSVNIEKYDLTTFNIVLSDFTPSIETTNVSIWLLSLMMATYIMFYIKKKRP